MTMVSMKVVLSGPDRTFDDSAPEEVELGPFTQGVVIGRDPAWSDPCLIDVASSRTIAVLDSDVGHVVVDEHGHLVSSSDKPVADRYARAFIQTYPEGAS